MDDKFWSDFEKAFGAGPGKVIPPPGEGWFSLSEYASRFKVNPTTARLRLARLVSAGKVERARVAGTNPARPSFYRMVPNG